MRQVLYWIGDAVEALLGHKTISIVGVAEGVDCGERANLHWANDLAEQVHRGKGHQR